MSNGQPNDNRDLLSRLNALKKSPITFDDTKPVLAAHLAADEAQGANPALALFSDLTSRFQVLKGAHNRGYTGDALRNDGTLLDISEPQNESNDKTVEELLADLGPDDQWTLGQNEDIEIEALLKDAHSALSDSKPSEDVHAAVVEPHGAAAAAAPTTDPAFSIDVSAFQPEPDSGSSTPSRPLPIDDEAELTLQRLLDKIALDPSPSALVGQADGDYEAGLDLPALPSREDDTQTEAFKADNDDALARRFASLSLPTASRTQDDNDELGFPSVPTGLASTSASNTKTPADDEIDTWCIICLDDANLKCLGCDGDLYCTKCWMEGHTGEDAGYEERRHKAVQYVKKGRKEKKRLVGA